MDIGKAAAELAEQITALGVPAVVDSRDLNPPGAWVTVAGVSMDYLNRVDYGLNFQVFLLTRDAGTPAALDELGGMLTALVGPLKITEATPQAILLPNLSADPLPALAITLETRITGDTP